jgi:hypothetical protein
MFAKRPPTYDEDDNALVTVCDALYSLDFAMAFCKCDAIRPKDTNLISPFTILQNPPVITSPLYHYPPPSLPPPFKITLAAK